MRRTAFWLTVGVVFTLPWENAVAFGALGAVSRAVGLFAAAAWLLSVVATRSVRWPDQAYVVAFCFVLWNGLSVVWSVNPPVSIGRFLTFVQLFLMAYLLWDTARTERDVRHVLQAYVLGAWVTVVLVVGNYLVRGAAANQVRFTLGTFQPDELGMVLALAIPAGWYLAMTAGSGPFSRTLRLLDVLVVPGALTGVMFSGSRAAMIATVPSLLYVVGSWRLLPRRTQVLAGLGVAGGLIALIPLVPADTLARLTSTAGDRTQGDFDGRTELWQQAYATFERHPLTGVGTGAFREESSWKVAHNVWLRMAAELGAVGLALLVLLFVLALVYGWQMASLARGFVLASVTSLAIGATFYNLEAKKSLWLFVLLPVLMAGVDRVRAARQRAGPRPVDERQPAAAGH